MRFPNYQTERRVDTSNKTSRHRAHADLTEGDLLSGRFRVVGPKPGSGQFAEVYKAVDEQDPAGKKKEVAIKIEREDKTSSREMALRDLQGCKGVAKLVDSGSKKASPFIVMELMKANLADVRSKIPGQRRQGDDRLDRRADKHPPGDPRERVRAWGCQARQRDPRREPIPRRRGTTRTLCLIDMGLAKKFETASTPSGPRRVQRQHHVRVDVRARRGRTRTEG